MKLISSTSVFKYGLLAALLVFLMTQMSWKTADGKYNFQIISGDGVGYYQYLVNYFYNETIENQKKDTDFMMEYEGRVVNKCFAGAALCMAPFYKLAEFHSLAVNEAFDPYSPRTKKWINVGSLIYVLLSCFFIFKWLTLLGVNQSAIFWSIFSVLFGSNLFLYAVLSPSMTHVYSFFAVSGFLFFCAQFFQLQKAKSFLGASFFLGLIVIIRPINGVVLLLLPFLANGFETLRESMQSIKLTTWVKALLLGFIPVSVQLYLWYLQTGDWIVWSYGEEGFYWGNPQVVEVLFGFRKGWFVYTPIALLAFFSLPFIYKKSKTQFISIVLFFIVLVYVVSSWWNWYYGSSFGQRSFVDFYAVVAMLLAVLLERIKRKRLQYILSIVFIFGLVGLNLFQSFQYKENIISSWDMTARKYEATFGVSQPNQVRIGGSREILPFNAQKELIADTVFSFPSDYEYKVDGITEYFNYSDKEYGVAFKFILPECSNLSRGYYIELEVNRMELELNSSENAKVVVELKNQEGEPIHYAWFLLNEVPAKDKLQWANYEYQVSLPKCNSDHNELLIYIRNEDQSKFLISKFEAKVFDIY